MRIPIISNWLEQRNAGTFQGPSQWLTDALTGGPTAAGRSVNPASAMSNTAVYACVRVLAETVASLPLNVYERLDGGKNRDNRHPLYRVLHSEPNPEMTSFVFREMLMYHLCTWGNGYAEIERNVAGQVVALWPLLPDRTVVERDPDTGKKFYRITDLGVSLRADQVLHIPGFGFDGLKGKSPITMAREAVGLALSAEEYGARFFGNGAKPGGVLEHPGTLKPDGIKRLRQSWDDMHRGMTNQHRIAILEEGLQYKQIGLPPGDSQFIETRKFQLNEIARVFRVPPHMIGDLERSTNNNIEHQSIEFVVHTIRPYLARMEQDMNRVLICENDKERYFCEFVVEGLLRGDIQSRYTAYATARQWGWYSVNDIRGLENMNKIENGDVYLQPMNMVEAGMLLPTEPDPPELPEGRSKKRDKEERALRSASARLRLTQQHEASFERAAARVVKIEVREVKKKAKEFLSERGVDAMNAWMEKFYREQMPAEIRKHLLPSFRAFAVLIFAEAAKEIDGPFDGSRDLEQFIPKYLDGFIRRYTGSSKGQLQALLRNLNEDFEQVEDRLDEWSDRRPGKVAMNETTRLDGAVSKLAYIIAGATVIRWVTTSGRPCPYCEEMDQKTVGVSGSFAQQGTEFSPNGAEPLKITANVGHPPLHQGCQCQIVAD